VEGKRRKAALHVRISNPSRAYALEGFFVSALPALQF
jgi:hypothetical protein